MGPGTALPGLVTVAKVTFPLCFVFSSEKWKCLPRARWCVRSAGAGPLWAGRETSAAGWGSAPAWGLTVTSHTGSVPRGISGLTCITGEAVLLCRMWRDEWLVGVYFISDTL